MKLLHVVHTFDAEDAGGTERYTRAVTAQLTHRHDVSVFTFALDPAADAIRTETATNADGVRVITVHRRSGAGLRDRREAQSAIARTFEDHLRQTRPDVVHVQHLTGLSPELIGIPARLGIPAVLTLHDFWFLCPRIHLVRKDGSICLSGPRGGLACMTHCNPATDALGSTPPRRVPRPADAAFVYRFRRSVAGLRSAPLMLAPSEFVRGFYADRAGLDPSRIRVLPHGLDPIHRAPDPVREGTASPRPVRFGFLGLVSTLKGADLLLDAFEGIDPPEATLHLHGPLDRDDTSGLRARIDQLPAATHHGPYRHQDLGRILGALDVVVNPSRAMETFSFVVREALSAGVPVIASRSGALPEAVREGVDGYLVSGPEELTGRIRSLIAEPGTLSRLVVDPPAWPSVSEHAESLEAIYRELAEPTG